MVEKTNAAPNGRIREIRITGALVASVVGLIPQVSRIEEKLINMSMSAAPKMRTQVNSITDRMQRAIRAFEEELRSAGKDADVDSRNDRSNDRAPQPSKKPKLVDGAKQGTKPQAGGGKAAPAQQKQAEAKPAAKPAQATVAVAPAQAGGAQKQPQPQKPQAQPQVKSGKNGSGAKPAQAKAGVAATASAPTEPAPKPAAESAPADRVEAATAE